MSTPKSIDFFTQCLGIGAKRLVLNSRDGLEERADIFSFFFNIVQHNQYVLQLDTCQAIYYNY